MKDINNKKVRAIAFYLPQFYPTPENDEWWEPGFTEWTNVVRSKPLYRGHYQPRIPRDLGFYDLRVPETRDKQAQLAKEAGIEGFCYWHYWFAGRRLLDRIFTEVVKSGKPDYPFCLCWANHSWYQKTWRPNQPDKLLIAQTYPGEKDYTDHFYAMLPAFKDKRYMKYEGKLIYGIYDPINIPSFNKMREIWERLAVENDLPGFFFFGFCQGQEQLEKLKGQKYDTIVYEHMCTAFKSMRYSVYDWCKLHIFHKPKPLQYSDYINNAKLFFTKHKDLTPCLIPNFDHSPRSSYRWIIMEGSTPDKWRHFCKEIVELIKKDKKEILFIKAWNEWGEGNYLEPDMKYGKEYIEATREGLIF